MMSGSPLRAAAMATAVPLERATAVAGRTVASPCRAATMAATPVVTLSPLSRPGLRHPRATHHRSGGVSTPWRVAAGRQEPIIRRRPRSWRRRWRRRRHQAGRRRRRVPRSRMRRRAGICCVRSDRSPAEVVKPTRVGHASQISQFGELMNQRYRGNLH